MTVCGFWYIFRFIHFFIFIKPQIRQYIKLYILDIHYLLNSMICQFALPKSEKKSFEILAEPLFVSKIGSCQKENLMHSYNLCNGLTFLYFQWQLEIKKYRNINVSYNKKCQSNAYTYPGHALDFPWVPILLKYRPAALLL